MHACVRVSTIYRIMPIYSCCAFETEFVSQYLGVNIVFCYISHCMSADGTADQLGV